MEKTNILIILNYFPVHYTGYYSSNIHLKDTRPVVAKEFEVGGGMEVKGSMNMKKNVFICK